MDDDLDLQAIRCQPDMGQDEGDSKRAEQDHWTVRIDCRFGEELGASGEHPVLDLVSKNTELTRRAGPDLFALTWGKIGLYGKGLRCEATGIRFLLGLFLTFVAFSFDFDFCQACRHVLDRAVWRACHFDLRIHFALQAGSVCAGSLSCLPEVSLTDIGKPSQKGRNPAVRFMPAGASLLLRQQLVARHESCSPVWQPRTRAATTSVHGSGPFLSCTHVPMESQ